MNGLAYPFFRLASFRPIHRLLQGPPRHSSGIPTTTAGAVSVPVPVDRIRQRNFDVLFESLEVNGNPSRVWANYTNLLTFLGYEHLPLDIHRQVLRKCTPSSRLLRASCDPSVDNPTLDDYNFILEQFAAVGHHFGVMQVYQELTSVGIVPRTKTFGLCLQAIAHRLTLPVSRKDKARRIAVTRRMVSDLVNAMKSYNIPFTSVNLDLTMRILKETTDMQGFEMLMKWGYGIDLANPDCPPLEYMESTSGTDTREAAQRPTPQPFSTAALNTTIDTLGRLQDISRMVQAFEVLTTPLPRYSSNARSSYDEDDDDEFGVSAEPISVFTPPCAHPNTTTYNILLRHVSRAGHAVFARHYLLQAMELDRQVMLDLKRDIGNMPLEAVPSPHFAINRGTLLSVFGESNRDKNVGLMRWLFSKFPRILSKKRAELKFFGRYQAARRRKRLWPYEDPPTPGPPSVPTKSPTPPVEPSRTRPTRFTAIMARWKAPKGVNAVFDLDVEDESTPTHPPIKSFNLELHIRVLKRDISEITALYAHVQTILARTTQRVKERLGRRVWRGRDIYLLTDGTRRGRVSMERWEQIAGFKVAHKFSRGRRAEPRVFPWNNAASQRTTRRSVESQQAQSSSSLSGGTQL
ncbi:hypothetical protein B0H11DRAFT_1967709 [Mycena galericulata]|nr:hypothetical protein B0H11DRAFT_1967709 [Mycena galericulata]